jgi:hypothetical protein
VVTLMGADLELNICKVLMVKGRVLHQNAVIVAF